MSRRPLFLDNPGAWTRTLRSAQTSTDYACAITARRSVRFMDATMWVAVCLTLLAVAVLVWL